MRAFTVAGGLIERHGRLLLVQNRRRDGSEEWTTPGGVVDPGESVLGALTREVREETGLEVHAWSPALWYVEASAPEMAWTLHVHVHLAFDFSGEVALHDPDGIVVGAEWLDGRGIERRLATTWVPAREPMMDWVSGPWSRPRTFRYRVEGPSRQGARVVRLR